MNDVSGSPKKSPLISHHISRAECGVSNLKVACGFSSSLNSEEERRPLDMVCGDLASSMWIPSEKEAQELYLENHFC